MTAHAMIFGFSHVWSVRQAVFAGWSHPGLRVRVPVCGTREFPGPILYELDDGSSVLNPVVVAAINTVLGTPEEPVTWLVSMTQGNFYNQLGMVVAGGLFDFVLASRPDLPLIPDAVVMPCGAVRSTLEGRMREVGMFLRLLREYPFRDRIILIGPPPPPRADALIGDLLARAAPGSDAAEAVLVSPGSVRLKLWHLQNEIAAGYCAAEGVQYRSGALPGVQDDDGFLRPEMVKDAAHANHLYAAVLLDQLAAIITGTALPAMAAAAHARAEALDWPDAAGLLAAKMGCDAIDDKGTVTG